MSSPSDRSVRGAQGVRSAPAPLDLVQDLLNTRSLLRGFDRLATPEQARSWLAGSTAAAGAGLSPHDLTEANLESLRTAREALRAAALGQSQPVLAPVAVAAPLVVDLDPQGRPVVRAHPDAPRVLAAVLTALVNAADAWPRLKICANPGCRWAFYDTSRNRSGTWCDMNICGARAKMQRYRQGGSAGESSGPDHSGSPA